MIFPIILSLRLGLAAQGTLLWRVSWGKTLQISSLFQPATADTIT